MPRGDPAVQRTQRMPMDLWMAISHLAEQQGMTLSAMVNELLTDALLVRKQLNLDFSRPADLRGNTSRSVSN